MVRKTQSMSYVNSQEQKEQEQKLKDLAPNEFYINGKKVVLKTSLPLDDYGDLPELMANIDRRDLKTQIPVFVKLIKSWEFDGDPSDSKTYGNMDIVKEIMPMSILIQNYMDEELGLQLKNSGREFGSASALRNILNTRKVGL